METEIDYIPESKALLTVFPGAVYLNQNVQYLVTHLCLKTHQAFVHQINKDYYTKCRDFTDVEPVKVFSTEKWNYGVLEVKTRVVGFLKKARYTGETIELVHLSMPCFVEKGHGVWMEIPTLVLTQMREKTHDFNSLTVPSATHGINHLLRRIIPLYLNCDIADLRTSHPAPDQERPR